MHLAVAVHTTTIESEHIESRYRRMTWQHIHVALLAQLVAALSEQAHVVRTVRRMATEAV